MIHTNTKKKNELMGSGCCLIYQCDDNEKKEKKKSKRKEKNSQNDRLSILFGYI